MNLFELLFFILNAICGFLVGKYFWNNFGYLYFPVGFILGFFAPFCFLSIVAIPFEIAARIRKFRRKN